MLSQLRTRRNMWNWEEEMLEFSIQFLSWAIPHRVLFEFECIPRIVIGIELTFVVTIDLHLDLSNLETHSLSLTVPFVLTENSKSTVLKWALGQTAWIWIPLSLGSSALQCSFENGHPDITCFRNYFDT
jgi:hypothetical protein